MCVMIFVDFNSYSKMPHNIISMKSEINMEIRNPYMGINWVEFNVPLARERLYGTPFRGKLAIFSHSKTCLKWKLIP